MNFHTMTEHADTLNTMQDVYGDTYEAYYAAAETIYYLKNGKLPDWAVFLQEVEDTGNGLIFIHRDRDARAI